MSGPSVSRKGKTCCCLSWKEYHDFFALFMTIDQAHHIYNIQLTENVFQYNLFLSTFSTAAPTFWIMHQQAPVGILLSQFEVVLVFLPNKLPELDQIVFG
jgi:hypothetical protein